MEKKRDPDKHGDGMMGAGNTREVREPIDDGRGDRSDRLQGSERNTERTPTGDRANLGTQTPDRDAGSVERESEHLAGQSRREREGLHDDQATRGRGSSIERESS